MFESLYGVGWDQVSKTALPFQNIPERANRFIYINIDKEHEKFIEIKVCLAMKPYHGETKLIDKAQDDVRGRLLVNSPSSLLWMSRRANERHALWRRPTRRRDCQSLLAPDSHHEVEVEIHGTRSTYHRVFIRLIVRMCKLGRGRVSV